MKTAAILTPADARRLHRVADSLIRLSKSLKLVSGNGAAAPRVVKRRKRRVLTLEPSVSSAPEIAPRKRRTLANVPD